jgi:hypothetical protein
VDILKCIENLHVSERTTKEEILSNSVKLSDDVKRKILAYLTSLNPKAYTSAPVCDAVNGCRIDKCDAVYSDGVYGWTRTTVHYFECYDLRLNDDFVQHVLSV